MRALVPVTVALAFAAPLPAFAQESETEAAAAQIEAQLGNPAMQAAIAEGVAAASEALLDLPLAPLASAVARAAGEDPEDVDPHMTMRSTLPDAREVPDKVRKSLPPLMDAMGSMAGGIGSMLPALREMADRMRDAIDIAGDRAADRY